MPSALMFLVALSLVEITLWLPPVWRFRRYLAAALMPLLSAASGLVLVNHFDVWSVLVCLLTIYRLLNLLRIVQDRVHSDYLYHSTRRTAFWLICLQSGMYMLGVLFDFNNFSLLSGLHLLAASQVGIAGILLISISRNQRTMAASPEAPTYPAKDLPTVTVAIPARNETTDLEECLKSLLASTYQKLEILVLDDCSQNKRTPEIIRQFAQSGVRFISGSPAPGQWLAKNHAYQQLSEQASGELILFCGVDTRFKPGTVDWMVKTLLERRKAMLSVLPRNSLPRRFGLSSLLAQPSRYAWELSLPRRWLNRPPVLSTCWLIRRQTLEAAGGFAVVTRQIVPESYLSRWAARHDDDYSLVSSPQDHELVSIKRPQEQQATAIRTRYPQLHRRPELVALISSGQFLVLVWPLAMLGISLSSGLWSLFALSGLAYIFGALHYFKVAQMTYRRSVWQAWLALPLAALHDIWILHYSMWQYEFGEVLWKGRNVCVPVMRITSNLPKLS